MHYFPHQTYASRAARRAGRVALLLVATFAMVGCNNNRATSVADAIVGPPPSADTADAAAVAESGKPDGEGWVSLFDGKSLGDWAITKYGGEGEVTVEDGRIFIGFGSNASGITWTKPDKLPRMNYELVVDAMRYDGNDFFCGLTFPVGDDYCSLICGGWGGGVTGLSNVDRYDASENNTSQWINYENKRWYKIKLRVTTEAVKVWMDGKEIIDVEYADDRFNIRPEVDLATPLGFTTWVTSACLRNIYIRELPDKAAAK